MTEVVIVDSGGANLASLRYALERLGARTEVTTDGVTIASAERVVLPGVGAAAPAMERLRTAGLKTVLRTLTQPVLGVCLGMQLLFDRSDEGPTRCLGVLPSTAHVLKAAPGRPVPHMGWNELKYLRADPLLEDVADGEYVYFVHSYYAPLGDYTVAATDYSVSFSSVVNQGNIFGCQFHPERSGKTGAQILKNFTEL